MTVQSWVVYNLLPDFWWICAASNCVKHKILSRLVQTVLWEAHGEHLLIHFSLTGIMEYVLKDRRNLWDQGFSISVCLRWQKLYKTGTKKSAIDNKVHLRYFRVGGGSPFFFSLFFSSWQAHDWGNNGSAKGNTETQWQDYYGGEFRTRIA